MTVDLRDVLTGRANAVTPPDLQPQELVALGELAVRRRRRLALAAGATAVALVVGTTAAVSLIGDRATTQPTEQPRPAPRSLPLTYGDGQTLHFGDLSVDTGLNFLTIDVSTDGVVLTTLDGGIWFSDGRSVDRVGATTGGDVDGSGVSWTHARPSGWVVTDAVGSSLFAWLEYPAGPRRPELVVFDGAEGEVTLREPIETDRRREPVLDTLVGKDVYLDFDSSGGIEAGDDVVRVSADATQAEVSEASYDDAVRGRPRSLLLDDAEGRVLTTYIESGDQLRVDGSALAGWSGQDLFDGVTGEPLTLELPDGNQGAAVFLVQWLDDNRLVIVTGRNSPIGDVMVCDLRSERCTVEIPAASSLQESLLFPGDGLVGGELALMAAMRE